MGYLVENLGALCKTRFDGLCFQRQGKHWRFVDTSDGANAAIGNAYARKDELLASLESFAASRGYAQ